MGASHDIDGKESSKRVTGMMYARWVLYIFIAHYVISTIYSIFVLRELPTLPEEWKVLLFTGAGLLGVSLAERFSPSASNKK